MLPRTTPSRLLALQRTRLISPLSRQVPRRWMTPAPKQGETLLERRADRELPDLASLKTSRFARSFPIFLVIMAISSFAIFNYQKTSSPVIASALYALRASPLAREALGNDIYYRRRIPYISGEINPLHGRIDVVFSVKGTKSWGVVRFTSTRRGKNALFETSEWSLEMEDGRKIDLLVEGGVDPLSGGVMGDLPGEDFVGWSEKETKGFRK